MDEDRARVDFELGVNISSTVSRGRLSIELDKLVSSSVAHIANMIRNCHPFERLELSVQNNCLPPTSPEPLATTEPVKKFKLYKQDAVRAYIWPSVY